MHTTSETLDIGQIRIDVKVTIHADRARIWKALTSEVAAWWGAPYLLNDAEVTDLILEPQVGGRFYEVWGNEGGALWGHVTSMKREHWIEIRGQIGMGAPVVGVVCFELRDGEEGGTQVVLSHEVMGPVDDRVQASYDGGWQDLVGDRLKAWIETGVKKGVAGR
ncbi:MAG: SRPBCC domain-containing protein [bacterium]